jgi:transcriptional regulator with GAF, ATPase, and Fis domain
MSVVRSIQEDVADGNHLETPTWVTSFQGLPRTVNVRRCRLEVVAGPDVGKIIELAQPTIMIGRTGADLNLTDPKVSGLHAELRLQADGYRVRDLGSTNGTHVRGVRIVDGFIAPGSTIQIGKSAIVFDPLDESVSVPLWHESRLHGLIGGSAPMRHLFDLINRFAQSDATVLIQGETGAGKEGVADAIHQCSPRRDGPFVILDCSAIPEQLFEDQIFGHEQGAFTGAGRATIGVFEAAHGGTLFLDEIGELPLDVQSKLLRAVETRKIRRVGSTKVVACDVRIIAATNRDLAAEIASDTFRADLYSRLSGWTQRIPPLRDRKDDILPLALLFLGRVAPGVGISTNAAEAILLYPWPFNVRELEQVMGAAGVRAAGAGRVRCEHLPDRIAATLGSRGLTREAVTSAPQPSEPPRLHVPRDEAPDREGLLAVVTYFGGNIAQVADYFGKDRKQIYRWAEKFELDLASIRKD